MSTLWPNLTSGQGTNGPNSSHSFGQIPYSDETRIVLGFTMILMSVITVVANIIVIVTIAMTKRLRIITSVFLVNLALSDLMVGLIIMPQIVKNVLEDVHHISEVWCQIQSFMVSISCIGSALTVAAVSLDRYMAIIHCLQYTSNPHLPYAVKVLLCVWLQAILCSIPPFLGWGKATYDPGQFMCGLAWVSERSYGIFMILTSFCAPFMLMLYCYARIIKVARSHARRIMDVSMRGYQVRADSASNINPNGFLARSLMDPLRHISMFSVPSGHTIEPQASINEQHEDNISQVSHASSTTGASSGREARATFRLLALVAIFLFCWLPYIATACDILVHGVNSRRSTISTTVSTWCICLESTINPFVYAISNRRFRFSFRRLCRRRRLRKRKINPLGPSSQRVTNLKNNPIFSMYMSNGVYQRSDGTGQSMPTEVTPLGESSNHSQGATKPRPIGHKTKPAPVLEEIRENTHSERHIGEQLNEQHQGPSVILNPGRLPKIHEESPSVECKPKTSEFHFALSDEILSKAKELSPVECQS